MVYSATSGNVADLVFAWAAQDAERIAVHSERSAVTYRQLASSIERTIQILLQQGLENSDRVLIVSENSLATVVLFLAALKAGIVPAIINARLSAFELAKIEGSATAKRTVYVTANSSHAAEHAGRVETLSIGDKLWGQADIAIANNCQPQRPEKDDWDSLLACIVYTTGTTGTPKGVVLSHHALVSTGRLSASPQPDGSAAFYYIVAPLAHIMGLGSNFMAALVTGSAFELVARFDVDNLITAITSGHITNLVCVPTVYRSVLLRSREIGLAKIPNQLRSIRAGGAPLSSALKAEIEDLLGLPLENGYGMTECNSIARTCAGDTPKDSIGRPNHGVEVCIGQLDTAHHNDKTVGKLLVKSPCMAAGLLQDGRLVQLPGKVDGWLDTGDIGRIDADGYLYLVGRSKEIIIRSGFNIVPAEVEQAIRMHESVRDCAVVGQSRSYDEVEVVAFIVVTLGCPMPSNQDLIQHCKEKLVGYKRPTRFIFIDEIPQLPNGKIDRQALVSLADGSLAIATS